MKIIIPETLNDLTLGQWQEIIMIDKKVTEDFYIKRVFSIIYGIRGNVIKDIKETDINILMDAIRNILALKPKFENRFVFNKIEYGFIPNLEEITFGEFVDLDKYSQQEYYDKLMSILFRPIVNKTGNRYDIKNYDGAYSFKDIPLGIALGAIDFFFRLGKQLTAATLNSLTEEEIAQAKQSILQKNGDGMTHSII